MKFFAIACLYVNFTFPHPMKLDVLISQSVTFSTGFNIQLNGTFKSNNGIMINWGEVKLKLKVSFCFNYDKQAYPYIYLYTTLLS